MNVGHVVIVEVTLLVLCGRVVYFLAFHNAMRKVFACTMVTGTILSCLWLLLFPV